MFWQRDLVSWITAKPRLLGRQGVGATDVDFAEQIGIYLLHDRERVIYVGRASDQLTLRLRAHTNDRLGGRWDRFSWFGLLPVTNEGNLANGIGFSHRRCSPIGWRAGASRASPLSQQ